MENIKKVLFILLFICALYLTSYLFCELNKKDWYTFPTLFMSLVLNAVSFYLVGNKFIK